MSAVSCTSHCPAASLAQVQLKGERGITDNSVYIVGALPDAFPIPTQVLSSILAAWDERAKYNFRAHSGFRRLLLEFAES